MNKKRDERVKKKLQIERERRMRERQAERASSRLERKGRQKLQPIVNDDKLADYKLLQEKKAVIKTEKMINDDIKEAEHYMEQAKNENLPESSKEILERNYKILLELRDEFLAEQEGRKEANAELEAQGLQTLQEKVKFLGQQATEEKLRGEFQEAAGHGIADFEKFDQNCKELEKLQEKENC